MHSPHREFGLSELFEECLDLGMLRLTYSTVSKTQLLEHIPCEYIVLSWHFFSTEKLIAVDVQLSGHV